MTLTVRPVCRLPRNLWPWDGDKEALGALPVHGVERRTRTRIEKAEQFGGNDFGIVEWNEVARVNDYTF